MLWLAGACLAGSRAEDLFHAGEKAEKAGDRLHALMLYSRAAALEPANVQFAARMAALQSAAANLTKEQLEADALGDADAKDLADLAELEKSDAENADPAGQSPLAFVDVREIMQSRQALSPQRLQGNPGRKDFDITGDARNIFEQVAGAFGLQVVFEADYQTPPRFTFRVTGVDWEEALRMLETVANSFLVPVNPHLALVARDTPQKRAERAQVMAVAIPIPERMTVQDAQEIIQAVQQTLEIRRVGFDPGRRVVYMRDQVSKIIMAQQLFATLSKLRAQVEIEVEFVSVVNNSSLNYGLKLPTSVPLVNFGSFFHSTPTIPVGFTSFLTFGGGATFLGLGISSAAALATVTKSSNSTVLRTQITTLDGQAVQFHVGDRYPIIASGYFGTTTGTGQVFSPPPTVNFEDLGLVLKITPSVHADGEVTLDIDSEFKVLGNDSFNGIPTISNRKYTGEVRLGSGEWAVVAGLVSTEESVTRTGIPGLSSIPGLGHLFSTNTNSKDSTDVLVIIKPHIVARPAWDDPPKSLWVGTDSRPITIF
jgi:general secretion pathway protein D